VNGEPLLSQSTFSAIILMVLLTTLLAPIALRWVVARERGVAGRPPTRAKRGGAPAA
jgi:hypothetical protein